MHLRRVAVFSARSRMARQGGGREKVVTDEVPNVAACWALPAGLASLELPRGGEGEDHKGSTGSCRAEMRGVSRAGGGRKDFARVSHLQSAL